MDSVTNVVRGFVIIVLSTVIFLSAVIYIKNGMWRGKEEPGEDRFQVVYSQDNGIEIVEDTETGVKYLCKNGLFGSGSFTVLEGGEDENMPQELTEEK